MVRDEALLTVDQVADFLQVCKETVRRYVRNGDLKCAKLGRQFRFSKEHLEDFILRYADKDLGEEPPETEDEVEEHYEEEDYEEEVQDEAPRAETVLDDHDII